MLIVGCILWVIMAVACFAGYLKVNDQPVTSIPGKIAGAVLVPIVVGVMFKLMGFIGDALLAPIIHFFF